MQRGDVRINRQSMRAGLPLDENRADAVGHESDDEANDVSLDDDVLQHRYWR